MNNPGKGRSPGQSRAGPTPGIRVCEDSGMSQGRASHTLVAELAVRDKQLAKAR